MSQDIKSQEIVKSLSVRMMSVLRSLREGCVLRGSGIGDGKMESSPTHIPFRVPCATFEALIRRGLIRREYRQRNLPRNLPADLPSMVTTWHLTDLGRRVERELRGLDKLGKILAEGGAA